MRPEDPLGAKVPDPSTRGQYPPSRQSLPVDRVEDLLAAEIESFLALVAYDRDLDHLDPEDEQVPQPGIRWLAQDGREPRPTGPAEEAS